MKVHGSIGSEIPNSISKVEQVGSELSDNIHAELKLLQWLVNQNATGSTEIYVSKLCCKKCRIAIDAWNKVANIKLFAITPGGHGDYYPHWDLPQCFGKHTGLKQQIIESIQKLPDLYNTGADYRGRSYQHADSTQSQRDVSVSPPPREKKVEEWTKPNSQGE